MTEIELLSDIIALLENGTLLFHVLIISSAFNSAFTFCLFLLHAKNQRDFI